MKFDNVTFEKFLNFSKFFLLFCQAVPGVTRIIVHDDIPGVNNVSQLTNDAEELLVSQKSIYAGQPIGIVVASKLQAINKRVRAFLKLLSSSVVNSFIWILFFLQIASQDIAEKAAKMVKVSYYDSQTPILTCKDAIKNKSFFPQPRGYTVGDAAKAIAGAAHQIKGEVEMGTQNHFHLETEVHFTLYFLL